LGQLAAQAVLELLAGQEPTQVLPSPRLMLRESTRTLERPARRR
jgi:DNA-binding LacI/PurR family transcriptional regulator